VSIATDHSIQFQEFLDEILPLWDSANSSSFAGLAALAEVCSLRVLRVLCVFCMCFLKHWFDVFEFLVCFLFVVLAVVVSTVQLNNQRVRKGTHCVLVHNFAIY